MGRGVLHHLRDHHASVVDLAAVADRRVQQINPGFCVKIKHFLMKFSRLRVSKTSFSKKQRVSKDESTPNFIKITANFVWN